MKGVRTMEATLFVAASMPKEIPHAIEINNVMIILEIVLNVKRGRFATSGIEDEVMINQPRTHRTISPPIKLVKYFFKPMPHFFHKRKKQEHVRAI